MPRFAPWENPDLPAPFARVKRQIEGRTRHFKLWVWDERLVWKDCYFEGLWWASWHPFEGDLDDFWRQMVRAGQFGRAFSRGCALRCRGEQIGLPQSVSFSASCSGNLGFQIIADARGDGRARERHSSNWWDFTATDATRPADQSIRGNGAPAHSVWWPGLKFPHACQAMAPGCARYELARLPAALRQWVRAGADCAPLQLAQHWAIWALYQQVHQPDFNPFRLKTLAAHNDYHARALAHFELPAEAHLSTEVRHADRAGHQLRFVCRFSASNSQWEIERLTPFRREAPSAHDLLETALQLRDSLRPILTAAEIEEILAPSMRP